MKPLRVFLFIFRISAVFLSVTQVTIAADIIQGKQAEKVYKAEKSKFITLVQNHRAFIVRMGNGEEIAKPKEFTVKFGEKLFIVNEEEKFIHNVYDSSHKRWILRKQKPGEVAILDPEKGKYKLRCAIHPQMKINLIVE